ncbi:transcriptional regulator [Aliidongia dinghuensis]|uniref:Transcriptional regulator n=1 Tax=Aliidongia dinghuensis TaxID=1867774 RepID=A0A8J3E7B3_9PROT|nr:winged helix-turn-helix domain-containing protein [Aliidongia dinghuensis]GGF37480.1 transcriptional regulator [Aliidongia dinghuensis]
MLDGSFSTFAFGPFRLFAAERRLEKDGKPVRLGGRALDLLIVLVEHAGEIVSNRAILERVWHGVTVDENSLRFHVKNLRRALADDQRDAPYVTNVSGRGYCFAARVERLDRMDEQGSNGASFDASPNLPIRGRAIVGRTDNIELISREFSRGRLVTIAGPGGIGKTTLAMATAEALRRSFGDAVFFVELAPVEDAALVLSAVVSALGIVRRADEPMAAIVDFLRDRRLLIVLDNCEQVIEAVAALADHVIQNTVGTHVLVTSRETLRIQGERVHRLMPLACPPVNDDMSAEEAMSYAAVQLFVDRTTAGFGGFSLNDALAPTAAEICRRLDGIPLAIELAAARVEFFGLPGLARGLNDMFALLTQGRRLALPRHQTLRAALDWSYHLLSPTEQAVLQGIAIFRTTFTLDSALAIVLRPPTAVESTVDAMANLVAKSMLTADSTGDVVQYRLLESTRIYANEKLAASGDKAETARRHADHHLRLLEAAAADWESDAGKAWLRLYAGRIDDIRAALDWCFSDGGDLLIGLHLMIASARLWFRLSLTLECRDRIEAALQFLSSLPKPDVAMEMRLQAALGHALWYSASDADRLERAFGRALVLADEVGDVPIQLQALWGLWASRRAGGRYREALVFAEKYTTVARASGDEAARLLGGRILGLTHHYLGDQETARDLSEQVLRIGRRTGNVLNSEFQVSHEITAATMLTRILWLQGLPDQATAMLQEAIAAAEQSGHWFSMYYTLCFAGCPLSLWIGNLAQTQHYLDMTLNRAAADRWRRCWALVLRLRQSGERGALIASSLEPRVDLNTAQEIIALASAATIPMPQPNDDVGDALWSLPEVLRVNAELLLWHGGADVAAAAESKLLRSLDLAQERSTLSWELRAATSLARLWHRNGRVAEARDSLAATCDRFSEGFDTGDFIVARQLIAEWS